MKPLRRTFVAACLAASFVAVGPTVASAQVPGEGAAGPAPVQEGPQAPDSWGTTSLSMLNLNAFAFETFSGTAVHNADITAGRYMVSGNNCFEAPLSLPTGAIIDHLQLDACDGGAGDFSASLYVCPSTSGPCARFFLMQTTGTPGCVALDSPTGSVVVSNINSTAFVEACTGATGPTNTLHSVRVFYRLQVSPAPATATFPLDVPTTHPFFKFVEAMAASGLTGGCGAGSFCPDQPVTRGQLSVFLASALGLHFPN